MFRMEYDLDGSKRGLFRLIDPEGTALLVERVDLADSRRRAELIPRIQGFTQSPPSEIEWELKKLAAEAFQRVERKKQNPPSIAGEEIDVQQTIRPERFITPEVSGLTIPVAVRAGDRVQKRWRVYLRWRDGRRECREMFSSLDLHDGSRLWVYPVPGDPPEEMLAGWSREARQRWLEGQPAPDSAKVFQEVCKFIAHYLDFRREEAPGHVATMALYTMLTYCASAFSAVPYLFFWGTAGSGKSRAMEVLQELVFRPYYSADTSPALVYRTLHGVGGTLLLDEAERLKNAGRDPCVQELLSLLQAGYRRGGSASRLEPVGDRFQPVSFQVFGPKALASISGPPPTLASRCILIPMIRASADSPKPKRRLNRKSVQLVRDMLHAWALEYGETFLELPSRDVCPPEIFGRNWELWQPILALADLTQEAGAEGLLNLLQEHALRSVEASQEETIPAHDEVLLQILVERLRLGVSPTPGEVLEGAAAREPHLFTKWSAEAVSNHLKRYGLSTQRSNGRRIYSARLLKELLRVEKTYGIDLGFSQNLDTTPREPTLTDPADPVF